MAALVSLHPLTDRGREILDKLEARTEMRPTEVENKTRQYYLNAADADVDAFDPMLDKIDPHWRNHVSNLTPHS
jgi:hypothetical protein